MRTRRRDMELAGVSDAHSLSTEEILGLLSELSTRSSQRESRVRSEGTLSLLIPFMSFIPVIAALLCWGLSLAPIDPSKINDLGLVHALPAAYFIALALLTVSFLIQLWRNPRAWILLGIHLAALIVILYASVPLMYPEPRYAWVYKHIGVTDRFIHGGAVNPAIDIYNNWPGFFFLVSLVARAIGLTTVFSVVPWAQLAFNALFAAGAMYCFHGLSRDWRQIWLATWLFEGTNWIAQDYFAPQAFAFVLMLVILGTLLRLLGPVQKHTPRFMQLPVRNWASEALRLLGAVMRVKPGATKTQKASALAVVVPLVILIVVSHPLTPVALFLATISLVIVGKAPIKVLPLIVVVLAVGWDATMARTWLSDNHVWFGSLGNLLGNTDSSLVNVSVVPFEAQVVDYVARGLTATLWLLAVLGWIRLLLQGKVELAALALFAAPFVLLAGTSYGDEALFRIYLFAAPWAAYLVAGAILPRARASWRSLTVAIIVVSALMGATVVSAFGSERMNYIRPGEVQAARWLYSHTPANSLDVLLSPNFPLNISADYPHYRHFDLTWSPEFRNHMLGTADVPRLIGLITDIARSNEGVRQGNEDIHDRNARPASAIYIVYTTGMSEQTELQGVLPNGAFVALVQALRHDDRFAVAFSNHDSTILRYRLWPEGQRR
jgi:hypothetical protein